MLFLEYPYVFCSSLQYNAWCSLSRKCSTFCHHAVSGVYGTCGLHRSFVRVLADTCRASFMPCNLYSPLLPFRASILCHPVRQTKDQSEYTLFLHRRRTSVWKVRKLNNNCDIICDTRSCIKCVLVQFLSVDLKTACIYFCWPSWHILQPCTEIVRIHIRPMTSPDMF